MKIATRQISRIFSRLAVRYDRLNDVISLGTHRWVKREAARRCGAKPGAAALDLAGGTGDLAFLLSQAAGPGGRVAVADINDDMMRVGRRRAEARRLASRIDWIRADAERLPFPGAAFDIVAIGFGIRNFADKPACLREIRRILKPGGRLVVVEFSRPPGHLAARGHRIYLRVFLPLVGRFLAKDAAGYRYLARSIMHHPGQDALRAMMERAGFAACRYRNLLAGAVAIHEGVRPEKG